MSDITSTAQVNLLVNGQQAEETLANLRKRALDLTNEIAKAAAAGDKVTLQKLRKEFRETNRQIKEMESATQQVDSVLRRLDKATPHELQKALATLNKQLGYMERGSDVWELQTAKIRRVKDEIARVNTELARSQTFLERVNSKWQEWQAVAMGAAAAATGMIMAGRSAVKAYADMDEQMTNTRKYTGMTVQQVKELNDAFKNMDTRTGRDALNELAQEAGRLGKTTIEDVQGYVEAADIINVALCDLGEGATQTIAKLASIFRVDAEMGTRDAMLAVGSAVNVLSQNCTADKGFLVEFTQRMAGVGATAKMSIPDLLAFGATLDANGQKCEMSASNLGKLIMQLYQKPKELAQAVGLDVNKFTDVLSKSTNEAVIMFIEQVGRLGSEEGLARLAPLFKDIGMDGVRMSQVLATLADHIDMVRWEQVEAAKAFEQATSATNEYTLFNNTAQAGLDKAKKGFSEMSIELGEKLVPIMRHVITSSSATLRLMSKMADFISEHKAAIVTLTASVVAYTVAANAANMAQKLYSATVKTATTIQRAFNTAVKQNPIGLIAAAVAAAVTALIEYRRHLKKVAEEHDSVGQAQKSAFQEYAQQKARIDQLTSAVHNNALSLGYRKKALKDLQAIVPAYHASLSKEGELINDNTTAVDNYLKALKEKLQFQAYQDKLQEQYTRRAETELALDEAKIEADKKKAAIPQAEYNPAGTQTNALKQDVAFNKWRNAEGKVGDLEQNLADIDAEIDKLVAKIGKVPEVVVPVTVEPVKDDTPIETTPKPEKVKNKFQAEDDWRERELALNRIAYAKGEADYDTYTKRMLAVEVEYNQKKLARTDLVGNEQVTIEAAYHEAIRKQQLNRIEGTVEDENRAYNELQAIEQQRYADGALSAREYQEVMEQLELEHLKRTYLLYDEGSKERLKAEKAYHDTSIRYQQRHLQEARKQQETMRTKYFTKAYATPDQESYQRDLKNLEMVYQQMLVAAGENSAAKLQIERAYHEARYQLARQYNIDIADDTLTSFRQAIDESVAWLESDGGKALTGTLSTVLGSMNQMLSSVSDIVKAELEIETAAIEKQYEARLTAAEGNKSKEVLIEQEKEQKLAAAKSEANKKMFAMQVMQAIAQTAMAAISAYSSAAAIPVVGWAMAPAAAAMAVAAGALEIAAIKKQQQASEATGYMEGGFTRKGRKDEIVGSVHAGEWVASQQLLANPTARAMVETLDYAQRTNTIGQLSAEDVSQSITAPTQIAKAQSTGELAAIAMAAKSLADASNSMTNRLNEPFVTVNTVTGDAGIKRAQDNYNKFIKNKTPKSRR